MYFQELGDVPLPIWFHATAGGDTDFGAMVAVMSDSSSAGQVEMEGHQAELLAVVQVGQARRRNLTPEASETLTLESAFECYDK